MNRDFVAMADLSPGRWLAAEFGEVGKVQSRTPVDDAGWQL
jgi:hypothetical protein